MKRLIRTTDFELEIFKARDGRLVRRSHRFHYFKEHTVLLLNIVKEKWWSTHNSYPSAAPLPTPPCLLPFCKVLVRGNTASCWCGTQQHPWSWGVVDLEFYSPPLWNKPFPGSSITKVVLQVLLCYLSFPKVIISWEAKEIECGDVTGGDKCWVYGPPLIRISKEDSPMTSQLKCSLYTMRVIYYYCQGVLHYT